SLRPTERHLADHRGDDRAAELSHRDLASRRKGAGHRRLQSSRLLSALWRLGHSDGRGLRSRYRHLDQHGDHGRAARAAHGPTPRPDARGRAAGGPDDADPHVPGRFYAQRSGAGTPADDMGAKRAGHIATLLKNGLVLVAGSFGAGADALTTAELYDPSSDAW